MNDLSTTKITDQESHVVDIVNAKLLKVAAIQHFRLTKHWAALRMEKIVLPEEWMYPHKERH